MKAKKPILIILGEPNSVFVELISKVISNKLLKQINRPIILIGSENLLNAQLKVLKRKLLYKKIEKNELDNKLQKKIYLINVNYNFKKAFEKISYKSRRYISNCFFEALKLLNTKQSNIIINGPISKKYFLRNKFPGITEYIHAKSKKRKSNRPVMLIFNKSLSVSPISTHIPLKYVYKKINIKNIVSNVMIINSFYTRLLKIKPKIALLGLNPHCETKLKYNEEIKIIKPAIKKLRRKKINVTGPYSADTFFLKHNLKKYNSVVGMYHDQVLTPFKTLYNFDASNITLGLPFIRLSVDHGPNENMLGKNKSDTKSLKNIFNFIVSIK